MLTSLRGRRSFGLGVLGGLILLLSAENSCGVQPSSDCTERADCPTESSTAPADDGQGGGPDTTDTSTGAGGEAAVQASAADASTEGSGPGNDALAGPEVVDASDVGSSAPDVVVGAPTNLCGVPSNAVSNPIVFEGATGQTCQTNIPAPRNGFWFPYNEPNPNDAAVAASAVGAVPGCNGANACAIHGTGSGFTLYAGLGFNLNGGASTNTAYDASAYSGIEFWAHGTITGSRAGDAVAGFVAADQTLFVELVGATNRPMGDEYGAYCTLAADGVTWTHCRVDFAAASRLGFAPPPDGGPDAFDRTNLYKVQFHFSPFMGSATAPAKTVSFDVWIDDVFFY